jgi:hypothetical protein
MVSGLTMKESTIKHVIRFPADAYAKLRRMAELEDRSINSQVVAAIRQAIEIYEREHGSIDSQK